MSTISIYTPKENGDLKYIADVEDEDRPDMALDAVLDELPRIKDTTFLAMVAGDEEGSGTWHVLELPEDAEPERRPKRAIVMAGSFGASANGNGEEEAEEEAPKRTVKKTTAKKPAAKKAAAKTATAKKPTAKKTAARRSSTTSSKPTAKKSTTRSPFTRSAKSDD